MSAGRLEGRLALVTGASRGIGFAIARRFAAEGAHVIAVARTVGGLEELDDAVKEDGGSVTLAKLDLRKGDEIDALGASVFQRFGKLDILVGNAGVLGELSPVSHISPKVWEETLNVNTTANYRLLRNFDAMLRQSDAGRAIFVSSGAVDKNLPYWSAYTASKAALEALVGAYAREVADISNVRANIVQPGVVATAMRARAFPGEDQSKLTKPNEITDVFVDLASDAPRDSGIEHQL